MSNESSVKSIQAIYDEWRDACGATEEARENHYRMAERRNGLYKKLVDAVTPGDEIELDHDSEHKARITADYHKAIPGHSIRVTVEGRKNEIGGPIRFGDDLEGEKISRRK